METPSLEQLETRVYALVDKINKLRADNHRLHDELALSRQDYAAQAKTLEAERNKLAPVAMPAGNEHEALRKTLDHQTQEIQLLEKERLNLRDQIVFLQNTIQNKEKDWKEKSENIKLELDNQLQAQHQQLIESQERVSNLELRLQALQTDAEQAASDFALQQQKLTESEGSLKRHQTLIQELENKLSQATEQAAQQTIAMQSREQEQKAHFDAQLAQEIERFRLEYALLGKQHEQNLSDLTQALNKQKERLNEEKNLISQQLEQVIAQKQSYRNLLLNNAAEIEHLLNRLPAAKTPEQGARA